MVLFQQRPDFAQMLRVVAAQHPHFGSRLKSWMRLIITDRELPEATEQEIRRSGAELFLV